MLTKNTSFPIYITLKDLVAIRISEIHLARARWAYENWASTNDDKYLIDTKENLDKLDDIHRRNPIYINLKAILNFQLDADIVGAIKELNRLPKVQRLQAWHLNFAFLNGCLGKLSNAVRYYRLANKQVPDPNAIGQIEQFIDRTIKSNPSLYQLHYCLGIFNLLVKGDPESARLDFNKFIQNSDSQKSHPIEYKMTLDKWIPEIKRQNPHHF